MGDFVACLQEVPAWGRLDGFTYSSHTLLALPNCDCAFIVPRSWMPASREFSGGAYWCGVVIYDTIYISAHILDDLEEDGRATAVFRESIENVHRIRHARPTTNFEIVIGVDANVQFPENFNDVSGDAVYRDRRHHSMPLVRVTTAWLSAMGVRAHLQEPFGFS